jgi:hypothetical protein
MSFWAKERWTSGKLYAFCWGGITFNAAGHLWRDPDLPMWARLAIGFVIILTGAVVGTGTLRRE